MNMNESDFIVWISMNICKLECFYINACEFRQWTHMNIDEWKMNLFLNEFIWIPCDNYLCAFLWINIKLFYWVLIEIVYLCLNEFI